LQNLLTNKTASLTELRNPKKVIDQAGGKPVAIFNRDQLEGYFVPASAVEKLSFEAADADEAISTFEKRKTRLQPVLDYLEDK
jgi:antitoxin StbD